MSSVTEVAAPGVTTPPPAGPRRAEDELGVSIPLSAMTWQGFREWAKSDAFPERGRISFLGEEIFIEMSPERLGSHNSVKAELNYVLYHLVNEGKLGVYLPDGALVSNEAAGVSNEPDAVFVSYAAVRDGRVTLVPSADGKDIGEILGAPDLVVEAVSPSSVRQDTKTLRARYHAADIPEYWLIDARGDELRFDILWHSPAGYGPAPVQDGWQHSRVLGRWFLLDRAKNAIGFWKHTLHHRPHPPASA